MGEKKANVHGIAVANKWIDKKEKVNRIPPAGFRKFQSLFFFCCF